MIEEKKSTILQLLNKSFIISPEVKEQVETKIQSTPPEKLEPILDALIPLLKEDQENENRLLEKIIEVNPNFLAEVNQVVNENIKEQTKEAEVENNQKEEKEIANIEEEMNDAWT